MEVEWSTSRLGRFTPRERAPGTNSIGGWGVGPRAFLDVVVKRKIPSPRRESNPITPIVQPVAQRYTDWAVTALNEVCSGNILTNQQKIKDDYNYVSDYINLLVKKRSHQL
jgi:hypothetical protein